MTTQWDDLFLSTVTTKRVTHAASGRSAAGTDTWANSLVGIAVAIQPLSVRELEQYGKVTPQAAYKMYTAAGQDILARDRVHENSTVYQIVGAMDQAGMGEVDKFLLSRAIED